MSLLESERLFLRPSRASDVQSLAAWLSDYDVAKMTARVPHPYGEADAEAFLARPSDENRVFVVEHKADRLFMGCVGLRFSEGCELGYWLGKPFWGFGYATEATRRAVRHAFEDLGQDLLHAGWFHDNPASGRVLTKLGARHNGSALRYSKARAISVLCHDMVLTQENFLRKQLA